MSRAVCVALAACLFLASSGCIPSHEVAAEKAGQVRVGMTRAEVVQTLGEPEARVYNLAASNGGRLDSFDSSEPSGDCGVRILFNAEVGAVQQVCITPPQ